MQRMAAAEPETVLRCGYMELSPYLHDTSAGPKGFAADVMNRAAEAAGYRLQWVRTKDADAALDDRTIDIFPVLAVTKERAARFHFSSPWWENNQVLLSFEKQAVSSPADTVDKRILIRNRELIWQFAQSLFPQAAVIRKPNSDDVFRAFCAGEGEAAFIDQRLVERFLLNNEKCGQGKLKISPLREARFELATVAVPEQAQRADRLYGAIAQLAAEGTLNQLAAQYSIFSAVGSEYVRKSVHSKQRAMVGQVVWGGLLVIVVILTLDCVRVRRERAATQTAWKAAEDARADLEDSQRIFETFMRHLPAQAHMKDSEGRLTYLNEAGARFIGRPSQELLGLSDFERWPQPFAERIHQKDRAVLDSRSPMQFVDRIPEAPEIGRGERELLMLKFPVPSRSGECHVGTVALDITEQKKSERFLHLSQFSIERSPQAVLWVDHLGKMFYSNSTAASISEYDAEALQGLHISRILADPLLQEWSSTWQRLQVERSCVAEVPLVASGGTWIPGELSLHIVAAGDTEFACAIWRDITERKQSQQELYFQAFHDQLTGLANRRLFLRTLDQEMATVRAEGSSLGLLFIDLDDFKLVNDQFGHSAGDEVLSFAGRAIARAIPSNATLGRPGGDEFNVLLPGFTASRAECVAQSLAKSLAQGFVLENGTAVSLTCSVGIALYPLQASTPEELYHNADLALYEAKRKGKSQCAVYRRSIDIARSRRAAAAHPLKRALERGEFELFYQPQFQIRDLQLTRYEALIRWSRPGRHVEMPDQFISEAEESGLIVPIGKWIFEAACRQLAAWRGTRLGNIPVAVNVSAVQLAQPDFVKNVHETLARHLVSPRLLELEITESALMRRVDESARRIQELRTHGMLVSIDDFGCGYSSLGYLRDLPIDGLKIDRSFVRELNSDPKAATMIGSIASLARSLNLRTVVEGVEQEDQLRSLRELDCDDAQGFYLGIPLRAEALEQKKRHARRLEPMELAEFAHSSGPRARPQQP